MDENGMEGKKEGKKEGSKEVDRKANCFGECTVARHELLTD